MIIGSALGSLGLFSLFVLAKLFSLPGGAPLWLSSAVLGLKLLVSFAVLGAEKVFPLYPAGHIAMAVFLIYTVSLILLVLGHFGEKSQD